MSLPLTNSPPLWLPDDDEQVKRAEKKEGLEGKKGKRERELAIWRGQRNVNRDWLPD